MTEDLIKKLKDVKQALVSKDMTGEEWEEREEILKAIRSLEQHVDCLLSYDFSALSKEEILEKLEDVTTYLKDALGKGIEF